MKTLPAIVVLMLLTACTTDSHTHSDGIHSHGFALAKMTLTGDQRCIISDGVPDHDWGPWREGAVVVPQDHKFCVDATPALTGTTNNRVRVSGVTVTGIPLRPGTAEYYDASSEKGYSRNSSSGWMVEGMGGLIMDAQNAHVNGAGYYHYHGIPSAVTNNLEDTLFAFAADGFEMHYVGGAARSSYQLKLGERDSGPNGPKGPHDGTYIQDWEYVAGSGTLDECNGAMRNGQYVYYATDTYPFFPRCFKGTVSSDFMGGRSNRPEGDTNGERPPRPERDENGQRPPRPERE